MVPLRLMPESAVVLFRFVRIHDTKRVDHGREPEEEEQEEIQERLTVLAALFDGKRGENNRK
jgi:hypothetical protein